MQYILLILNSYSWEGIALVVFMFVFFIVQIRYYLRYGRIAKYRDSKRRKRTDAVSKVSVIVPMYTENYQYVEERLPLLMAQEGIDHEVVIVYVGCDRDFYDDICRLKQLSENIVVTRIENNPRNPISIKTALNIGIKAARTNYLIFTTVDSYPTSKKWLAQMASGFTRGDIVLGYCGLDSVKGIWRRFIGCSRMMDSANWLSSAIKGKPYRGIRYNMGFTRDAYFAAKGYNHLNMNIGEDDLFLQKIISSNDVSIILSPRSTIRQCAGGGFAWWLDRCRYYGSAFKLYPIDVRNYTHWELGSRLLFFLSVATVLAFLPLELKVSAFLLLIIRYIVVRMSVTKLAKRLGEQGLAKFYFVYDLIFSPLLAAILCLRSLKRDKRVWR